MKYKRQIKIYNTTIASMGEIVRLTDALRDLKLIGFRDYLCNRKNEQDECQDEAQNNLRLQQYMKDYMKISSEWARTRANLERELRAAEAAAELQNKMAEGPAAHTAHAAEATVLQSALEETQVRESKNQAELIIVKEELYRCYWMYLVWVLQVAFCLFFIVDCLYKIFNWNHYQILSQEITFVFFTIITGVAFFFWKMKIPEGTGSILHIIKGLIGAIPSWVWSGALSSYTWFIFFIPLKQTKKNCACVYM